MVTSLTVQSDPTGLGISVTWNGGGKWVLTPETITFESETVVDLYAPNAQSVTEDAEVKGYAFTKWQKDTTDYSTDPKIHVTDNGTLTFKAVYSEIGYYPTRHPTRRAAKFQAKVNDEVYGLRTSALKAMMTEQMTKRAAEQELLERQVGAYLMSQGIYGHMMHHYRNYSQALYALKNRFSNATLENEATLVAKTWQKRGLDATHLTAIAKILGITITL
jgi:hypothetical protein